MSGKFFTIREDIIYFLILNIEKEFSVKDLILSYLHKNLYFEEGINKYERFNEIFEMNQIIKKMEKKKYISIKNKKIILNQNNQYVFSVIERMINLREKMSKSYNDFKMNNNFMEKMKLKIESSEEQNSDNDFEKVFCDDDRDFESEYEKDDDDDDSDNSNNSEDINMNYNNNGIYKIKSETSKEVYTINLNDNSCTCNGFIYSKYSPPICKHIIKFKPIKIIYITELKGKNKKRKTETIKYEFINNNEEEKNDNNYFKCEEEDSD